MFVSLEVDGETLTRNISSLAPIDARKRHNELRDRVAMPFWIVIVL